MISKNFGFSKLIALKRFSAKIVDLSIGSLLALLIFSLIGVIFQDKGVMFAAKLSNIPPQVDRILTMFIISIVIIPIQHHYFGNTFGKNLFGIKLTKINGASLSFKESQSREIKVFFYGLFFVWFSIIYQYFAFKRNCVLSWDKEMHCNIFYKDLSRIDLIIRFVICIFIWISTILIYSII